MDADELAALGWLLNGQGKERKGIEYNTPESPKVGYETAMAPARAALIRVLEARCPLNPEIRNALARALEPIGGSEMTLELKRRKGRGRPRNDVKAAVEAQELTNQIDAGKAAGTKQESLLASEPGPFSRLCLLENNGLISGRFGRQGASPHIILKGVVAQILQAVR